MLRFLVGIACFVVIAAGGLYLFQEFRDSRTRQQLSDMVASGIAARDLEQRGAALAGSGRCTELTTTVVNLAGEHELALSDIPVTIRSDLAVCASYPRLSGYEKHQLDRLAIRSLLAQ